MNQPTVIELSGAAIAAADGSLVLEQVDWKVEAGDFWVIAGGHGSGKSALLATVAGLNPVGDGSVQVFGEVLTGDHLVETGRRRVGLVFEAGGRLLRDLTVAENIALPVSYHENCSPSEALEQVLPLIGALQLERCAEASAGRIGRAWSQRVALARALAASPELLLLDNPIAGLDPYHVGWWRRFLPELNKGHSALGGRPLTLVLATDDLRPWLTIGNQFAAVREQTFRCLGDRSQVEGERAAELADWLHAD